MKCAWCEGPADAEYVDIGVGQQQVTPAQCRDCGAQQMRYDDDSAQATPEENRRRWWMGPDTEDYMIHDVDDDAWLNQRQWLERMLGIPAFDPRAHRLNTHIYVGDLMGVVHETYVVVDVSNELAFLSRCGTRIVVASTGAMPGPTCVACATRS